MSDVTTPTPKSWLRRNVLPLAIVVGSLALIVFLLLGPQLIARAQNDAVIPVAQGDTVDSHGYSFTLTLSQKFPGEGLGTDGNAIPLGDELIAAVIEVRLVGSGPAGDGVVGCDAKLTSRANGQDLTWSTVGDESVFDYAIGDDRTGYCILEDEDFDLESVFITPKGTYAQSTLDLTIDDQLYRFELVR